MSRREAGQLKSVESMWNNITNYENTQTKKKNKKHVSKIIHPPGMAVFYVRVCVRAIGVNMREAVSPLNKDSSASIYWFVMNTVSL